MKSLKYYRLKALSLDTGSKRELCVGRQYRMKLFLLDFWNGSKLIMTRLLFVCFKCQTFSPPYRFHSSSPSLLSIFYFPTLLRLCDHFPFEWLLALASDCCAFTLTRCLFFLREPDVGFLFVSSLVFSFSGPFLPGELCIVFQKRQFSTDSENFLSFFSF